MTARRTLGTGVSGVLDRLQNATRSRHAALAASPAMARLFASTYTHFEYRAHLERLLGLFEPLERIVARAANPGKPRLALNRSSALREDLRHMGATSHDLEALERCRQLPPIRAAGLRGYDYVMLGSMLGGELIVKRLRTVLGSAAGFRFYGDGSGRSEAQWASFCADLELHGKADVEAICATAVDIFEAYAAWLGSPPDSITNR